MEQQTSDKREIFLDNLKKEYPEMKVIFFNKITGSRWESEKDLRDLNQEEYNQVNLRKSRPNEIIFDVEDGLLSGDVEKKLKDRCWKYEKWYTGSRGYHYSVLFDNLGGFDLELRNRIRKYLIGELGTDEALSRENQFIALEYTPHFKTGNEKYLQNIWPEKGNNIMIDNNVSSYVIDYCKKSIEMNNIERPTSIEEGFENYMEDPFLYYMMTHTVRDGGRNNIVFKNLAVGLVKSGMDKEKMDKIVRIIVGNCPGKTIGEFMGWIEKVRSGLLNEYNRFEIVKWAIQYGHPIFYKLFEEVDLDNSRTIKDLWDILWHYKIVEQDVWRDMCFYNMISTVIQEKEEDLRIHPIFSCQSSTGKDEGLNLVKEILDKLGFTTYKPAQVTDKTLLGGVNQTQVEVNTKFGLSEGGMSGKREWKDPREMGILKDAQWIGFGESETVFNPKAYNQSLHVILRQAMDKSRTIQKGVGGLMIDIYTNTVFAFTTYRMPNIIHKLLNNGLFQRAVYYDKEITEKEHKTIREHISKVKFDPTYRTNFNEKKIMNLLCEKLKFMSQFYRENKLLITPTKEAHLHVNQIWEDYEKSYNTFTSFDRDILNSLIRRAITNLHKICTLSAVASLRKDVTREDIDNGFNLITTALNSVKSILLNVKKEDKYITAVLLFLKDSSTTTMMIHKMLEDQLGVKNSNTRTKIVRKCEDLKFITGFQDGRYTNYAITDLGREEIGSNI